MPTVAFYTLGCKVNQNETEALAALFNEKGYEIVDPDQAADVYVLNTCTVTHLADRKSRQFIRRAVKANAAARIVVMGCYAQVSPEEVRKIPGVSLIAGTSNRRKIIDWLEQEQKKEALQKNQCAPASLVRDIQEQKIFEEIDTEKMIGRSRAYLKVQEGCEQYCSYCIIPYARGPYRSRDIDNAMAEGDKLIKAGFKEIILTGIHLGAYGCDLPGRTGLAVLLSKLLPLDKSVRWRLSSLEPTEVSRELLQLMRDNANFCPHLHLPLQSGHDETLQRMRRPYTTGQFAEIVAGIRKIIPDICLSTDIMVGFPGETDEQFQSGLEFVREIGFGRIHVFQYSPRRGTPAAQFGGQVPAQVKEQRSRKLIELGLESGRRYADRFIGKTLDVLAETQAEPHFNPEQALWQGHSANYLEVSFASNRNEKGKIIPVRLEKVEDGACFGTAML